MKNAYHVHTYFCHHAAAPIRLYVENAVSMGIKTIAFSDHTPYLFPEGYVSSFRMLPEEAEDYFTQLRELKSEFADKIEIKIGFEAEYYPLLFTRLCTFLDGLGVDFLFLGQHSTGNEFDPGACSIWNMKKNPTTIWDYASQVVAGMQTGRFSMLAHPDVAPFSGDDSEYRRAMVWVCREALALHIPLEYNLLGLRDHRHYPSERFFRIAAEVGNTVVLGMDAHAPEVLLDTQTEKQALENLKALGISPVEDIVLKRILF